MKPLMLIAATASFVVVGLIFLLAMRTLSFGAEPLAQFFGILSGTHAAAYLHMKQSDAIPNKWQKAVLGAVLAVATILFTATLHYESSIWRIPNIDIILGFSLFLSFVYPFHLYSLESVKDIYANRKS